MDGVKLCAAMAPVNLKRVFGILWPRELRNLKHLVLLQLVPDILHVIVGENKTNVELAEICKLVEAGIAGLLGILVDHVLDHRVLSHQDGRLRKGTTLAQLRADNVHGLRSNIISVDDENLRGHTQD